MIYEIIALKSASARKYLIDSKIPVQATPYDSDKHIAHVLNNISQFLIVLDIWINKVGDIPINRIGKWPSAVEWIVDNIGCTSAK